MCAQCKRKAGGMNAASGTVDNDRNLVEEGSPLMGKVLGSIPGLQQKAAEEEGEKTLLALYRLNLLLHWRPFPLRGRTLRNNTLATF